MERSTERTAEGSVESSAESSVERSAESWDIDVCPWLPLVAHSNH